MGKPMADYVKLPELEEYKEWFKDFADLYREDGILQVTWKTLDGPMHHSGMSHRAISQLVRVLSLDYKNEIIIFTHIGDHWMTESDPNGWETYSELPKGKVLERAWEIARMWKTMPYENRTIMSNLAKRPLKKLLVEDLKLHTVSEQYGSLLRIAAGDLGDEHSAQQDEKYISRVNDWRYATRDMEEPQTAESWRTMPLKAAEWWKKVEAGEIENPYVFEHSNEPEDYEF